MTKATDYLGYLNESIPALLLKAKLINGDVLAEPDLIAKEKRTMFWSQRVETLEASKKHTFVVWTTTAPTDYLSGDEKQSVRTAVAYISVITNRKPFDESVTKITERIEAEFLNAGWRFEFVNQSRDPNVTERTTLSFRATKKLN